MILAHYQTLYESSVAFGMRKALQAARDKEQMHKKIAALENECIDSQIEIEKMDKQYDEIVQKDQESDELEAQKHIDLVKESKLANENYKKSLWAMLYNINN